MKIKYTIILLLFSCASWGQSLRVNYINKKTNQYLNYHSSSLGKNCRDNFTLISKTRYFPDKVEIHVICDSMNKFVDSLKSKGWTNKIKYIKQLKKYSASVELESISFEKMQVQDSLFKFVYVISLHIPKLSLIKQKLDTVFGTDKNKVLNTLKNNDYSFDSIDEIKGTTIIIVGLSSDKLLFPYKDYKPGVFAPYKSYYF